MPGLDPGAERIESSNLSECTDVIVVIVKHGPSEASRLLESLYLSRTPSVTH